MNNIECVKGSACVKDLTLLDSNGEPVTTFTSGATLAASLWRGDDQAESFDPAVEWIDATAGSLRLTFAAADTATLTPGSYPVLLSITAGSEVKKNRIATLVVSSAPGSAVALPTYCAMDDMLDLSGELAELMQEDSDLSGFMEQRHAARQWTDRTVLARARDVIEQQHERHSPVVASNAIDITTGVDAGSMWGRSIYPNTSIRDQVDAIRQSLEDDDLIRDQEMIEANAAYALWRVYRRQTGNTRGGTSYRDLAFQWYEESARKLAAWTARFDTTATPDGVADLEIEG
jgi:hypothetical protein